MAIIGINFPEHTWIDSQNLSRSVKQKKSKKKNKMDNSSEYPLQKTEILRLKIAYFK